MAGGPTRTLARSGSERRPSRHGVNTSLDLKHALIEPVGIHTDLKSRFGRPSGAIFFCAFARKKRPLCRPLSCIWLKLGFFNRRYAVGENCERTNDMAGGPTRTLARSGSERRPSRRGVNTSHQTETNTSLAIFFCAFNRKKRPLCRPIRCFWLNNTFSANDVLDEPTAKTPHALPAAN